MNEKKTPRFEIMQAKAYPHDIIEVFPVVYGLPTLPNAFCESAAEAAFISFYFFKRF